MSWSCPSSRDSGHPHRRHTAELCGRVGGLVLARHIRFNGYSLIRKTYKLKMIYTVAPYRSRYAVSHRAVNMPYPSIPYNRSVLCSQYATPQCPPSATQATRQSGTHITPGQPPSAPGFISLVGSPIAACTDAHHIVLLLLGQLRRLLLQLALLSQCLVDAACALLRAG